MQTQKITLITISIIGIVSIFFPWATLPFLGEQNGSQNSSGIISLLCYAIVIVLSVIGLQTYNKPMPLSSRMIITVLGVIIASACYFFINNVNTAQERMVAASHISIFGVPIGENILGADTKLFSLEPGVYLTCALAVILVIIALIPFGSKEIDETENS